MPEFENREINHSENDQALTHMFKFKMESMNE